MPLRWAGGVLLSNHLELFEYSLHRDFYYTADNLTKISQKLEIGKYAKE